MRNFEAPGRSAVFASNGMCATSHPLAAAAALDILKAGGNAVDAAIAGAVLLGVCEPHMTGIGGDCFALVKPSGGNDVVALNGSGRAPAGFDAERLRVQSSTIDDKSASAVTIPCAIDGFCQLSERFGKLGIADSLAPAIHYFEEGVPVAPRVARDWAQAVGRLQGSARDQFLWSGQPPQIGAKFRLPGQAEVLKAVQAQGRDGFYTGTVADDMVQSLSAMGGTHTLDDFASASATWETPISGTYRGSDVLEHPPNGQGTAALLLLALLEAFDVKDLPPESAARIHLEAEATKLAYAKRDELVTDKDHMPDPAALQDPKLVAELVGLIDPKRAGDFGRPAEGSPHKDTIYITVVDRDNMMVSLIYSVFHSFGSGIASDRFGILLQNRGAGFTLTKGHPNEAAAGKRPMHTIIPGMLSQAGEIVMPFGVMGGQYQSTGHARLISNLLDFGMTPQDAMDRPRSFATAGKLQMETGYSDALCAELTEMGHDVVRPDTPIGGSQAILRNPETGVLQGGSDPRKDGIALGY